jgi:hypothetical protein
MNDRRRRSVSARAGAVSWRRPRSERRLGGLLPSGRAFNKEVSLGRPPRARFSPSSDRCWVESPTCCGTG